MASILATWRAGHSSQRPRSSLGRLRPNRLAGALPGLSPELLGLLARAGPRQPRTGRAVSGRLLLPVLKDAACSAQSEHPGSRTCPVGVRFAGRGAHTRPVNPARPL